MPRRAAATIRPIEPDPVHRSKLVSQVINKVMLDGKKSTAEKIVYDALEIIAERPARTRSSSSRRPSRRSPRSSRSAPAASAAPPTRCPSRSRPVAPARSPIRWLVEFARNRRERTMAQRLANELLDAQSQQGGAYKRKDDIFRMAQANKAFAHYRW